MSNPISCPRCAVVWNQRGNVTGHCTQCHRTFEGIKTFDLHQRMDEDGSISCLDPETMTSNKGNPVFDRGFDLIQGEGTTWKEWVSPIKLKRFSDLNAERATKRRENEEGKEGPKTPPIAS